MRETMAPVWREALQEVKDPEIPDLSIVELGMVNRVTEEAGEVRVELTPTFVGCPALDWIAGQVEERLSQVKGVSRVRVSFVMDPPWTSERITPEGREKLKSFGIAPPRTREEDPLDIVPECPFCGTEGGEVLNLFGPTACRSIFYCRNCRQPFEGMKPI
ncbi:1,2-phenylacetyl-CoA epoxidase subunit PaaD [Kroppenstedtia eburnea]|uniref:Ring-1,2-phenylacetyl-CoA epoxidase subunit PaaD n=1 Tax=Kroppenstedtia eburnea TaxID=714067 RepID=A0A1N7MDT9_9BACL|nr:1,2-phenylacetyl-CoA epoxidase subunit PaaD [Kroppenstedtia eburnea]QKI81509.1 phenylacetate-CoA oxygenase subunit PaaJ [Kroppenstedtia eburnea]SIS84192.1 ring-1,2-phenylacetyl-CoA epoxidase subunit PaaD [Kroppenstedtia eburnea]